MASPVSPCGCYACNAGKAAQFKISISGITNAGCLVCNSNYNGDFILDPDTGNECGYLLLSGPTGCTLTGEWRLTFSINASGQRVIQALFGQQGSPSATYSFTGAADCMKGWTLSKVSAESSQCNWPATLTGNRTPRPFLTDRVG
jgi:hypothetical protein